MAGFQRPLLDISALRGALDGERRARGLTWRALGGQLGIPTIADMGKADHIQAYAVVLVLHRVRQGRGLTWAQVADELGTTVSVLARLPKGGRTSGPFMVVAADWPANRSKRSSSRRIRFSAPPAWMPGASIAAAPALELGP